MWNLVCLLETKMVLASSSVVDVIVRYRVGMQDSSRWASIRKEPHFKYESSLQR